VTKETPGKVPAIYTVLNTEDVGSSLMGAILTALGMPVPALTTTTIVTTLAAVPPPLPAARLLPPPLPTPTIQPLSPPLPPPPPLPQLHTSKLT